MKMSQAAVITIQHWDENLLASHPKPQTRNETSKVQFVDANVESIDEDSSWISLKRFRKSLFLKVFGRRWKPITLRFPILGGFIIFAVNDSGGSRYCHTSARERKIRTAAPSHLRQISMDSLP
jgi:hypothetical protein